MNIFRMVLAVVLPPLAVWDKGCGTVLLVTVLTVLFWIGDAHLGTGNVRSDVNLEGTPAVQRRAR